MEDGEEESEESSESVVQEPKVLPKRSTRGQRMTTLVGKAIEEDEEFYKGVFAEGESDEDFESQQESDYQRRDSFDSDFGKGDSDDDEAKKMVEREKIKKKGGASAQIVDQAADFDSEEERLIAISERKEKKAQKKQVRFGDTAASGARHKAK